MSTTDMGPKWLSLLWLPVFFSVVNQSERKVGHSPLSNVQERNEWSCSSTPNICLHVIHRETFTLSIYSLIDADNLSGSVCQPVEWSANNELENIWKSVAVF